MKNKLLTITAAILIVLGFGAGIASGHHPVIEGKTTCAAPDGSYTTDWTLKADVVRGLNWTIDGVTKADNKSFTFTTSHNLSGPAPSLTKSAFWSNGVGPETRTKTLTKPASCPVVTTTTVAATTTTAAPTTTTTVKATTTTVAAPTTTVAAPTTTTATTVPPTAPPTTTVVSEERPPRTTVFDPPNQIPATGSGSPTILALAVLLTVVGVMLTRKVAAR